jgi:hypothetical protein
MEAVFPMRECREPNHEERLPKNRRIRGFLLLYSGRGKQAKQADHYLCRPVFLH